ncbi:MAG: hypothetical protein INR64_05595 [Caulobacteraceae bacterium]|nr:hypothetical protein [Caulobacter sp.]
MAGQTPREDAEHRWRLKALEEEERSEHGLPAAPPDDKIRPAGSPATPRDPPDRER